MQSELLALQGLGKLSKSYLYRLVKKTITCSDGIERCGASKYELLSIIYLSQIADSSGYIKQFRIKEFADVIRCSEREVYVIMENLVAKQYISAKLYNNKKWTGFRNIRLLGNDFSKVKKFTRENRYLNTFFSFFDWSDANMDALDKISLYALRFLLLLLFEYNYKNGCNLNTALICEQLGIENRKLLVGYLKELEDNLFYDTFYQVKNYKRKINNFIHIYSKNVFLMPEDKPADKQLTYYKRKWMLYLYNNKAIIYNNDKLVKHNTSYLINQTYILNRIFSFVSAYLLKGHLLKQIEAVVENVLEDSCFIIDILVLERIGARLKGQFDFKTLITE